MFLGSVCRAGGHWPGCNKITCSRAAVVIKSSIDTVPGQSRKNGRPLGERQNKKLGRHPWRNKIFEFKADFLLKIRYPVCSAFLAIVHAAFLFVFHKHFLGVHRSANNKITLGEPFLYKYL